jgi:hypothetical protein
MKMFLAALLLLTSATANVEQGMPRWRVENRVLHDKGHRVLMYATDKHRFLVKTYDGDTKITYRGPLCKCGPYAGPYHVWKVEPR